MFEQFGLYKIGLTLSTKTNQTQKKKKKKRLDQSRRTIRGDFRLKKAKKNTPLSNGGEKKEQKELGFIDKRRTINVTHTQHSL